MSGYRNMATQNIELSLRYSDMDGCAKNISQNMIKSLTMHQTYAVRFSSNSFIRMLCIYPVCYKNVNYFIFRSADK